MRNLKQLLTKNELIVKIFNTMLLHIGTMKRMVPIGKEHVR